MNRTWLAIGWMTITLICAVTFWVVIDQRAKLSHLGYIQMENAQTDVWRSGRCMMFITKFKDTANPAYYFDCSK